MSNEKSGGKCMGREGKDREKNRGKRREKVGRKN